MDNDFNWRYGESVLLKELRAHLVKSRSGLMGAKVARGKGKYMEPVEKPFQRIITAFSKAKAKQ